jgi:FHS family L-fucose permease-like MFS transporter
MAFSNTDEPLVAKNQGTKSGYLIPFILVTSLFFLWGLANSLNGTLIHHFQTALNLSRFQAGFIDSAFYMGYFVMAIPAALLLKKYGYKTGFITGLILFGTGAILFYPAANLRVYSFFLIALFILACGVAILEAAANPYITVLGPQEDSEKRLNFSQSFNGISVVLGPIIGGLFIFGTKEYKNEELLAMPFDKAEVIRIAEAHSVQLPYLFIGGTVLLFSILFMITKMPEIESNSEDPLHLDKGSFWTLFKHRHLTLGAIAQFCDVGAQATLWAYFVDIKLKFAPTENWGLVTWLYRAGSGYSATQIAAFHASFALVLFMLGRFVGTYLMNRIKPSIVLGIFASGAVLFLLYGILGSGLGSVIAIMGVYFFNSIMFPTIFALATKNLGTQVKLGSSIIIMSIVGGAIVPIITGKVSLEFGLKYALIIPLICFTYIVYYGFQGYKVKGLRYD